MTTLAIPPMADQSKTGLAIQSFRKNCPGVRLKRERSTKMQSIKVSNHGKETREESVHDFSSNANMDIVKIKVANTVDLALKTIAQMSLGL